MLTGYTPFFSEDHMDKYKLIVSATLKFPRRGVSDNAKDLLTKLLRPQPSSRLGAGGVHEIQEHPFFQDIDWKALADRKMTPPFKPSMSSSSPERSPLKVDLELPSTPDLSDDKSSSSSPRGSDEGSRYMRHRRTSCEVREHNQEPEKEHDWVSTASPRFVKMLTVVAVSRLYLQRERQWAKQLFFAPSQKLSFSTPRRRSSSIWHVFNDQQLTEIRRRAAVIATFFNICIQHYLSSHLSRLYHPVLACCVVTDISSNYRTSCKIPFHRDLRKCITY